MDAKSRAATIVAEVDTDLVEVVPGDEAASAYRGRGAVCPDYAQAVAVAHTRVRQPDSSTATLRFTSGRRYIEIGAAAAEAAVPRLSAVFPWLRK